MQLQCCHPKPAVAKDTVGGKMRRRGGGWGWGFVQTHHQAPGSQADRKAKEIYNTSSVPTPEHLPRAAEYVNGHANQMIGPRKSRDGVATHRLANGGFGGRPRGRPE